MPPFKGRAQAYARTRITKMFPDEYRKYYLEEKQHLPPERYFNSVAQGRAVTRLIAAHRDAYNELREEAVGLGYIRSYPRHMRKPKRREVYDE